MTLVSSINIAKQALMTNQAAISVVSNNLANVNTEGYTKQRVNLAEVISYTPTYGNAVQQANGLAGVTIASITGAQNNASSFMQGYYRQENSDYEYLNLYSTVASNIEDLTNTMNDTGLSKALSDFYEAADTLADAPTDATARESYIQACKNVTQQFNSVASSLSEMKASLVGDPTSPTAFTSLQSSQIYNSVEDVNNIIDQLGKINQDIVKTSSCGQSSSSLIDQRNTLLKNLTALTPVNITESDNGTVNISIGGQSLIEENEVSGHLEVLNGNTTTPAIISVISTDKPPVTKAGNINDSITSGSIGAILDVCGNDPGNLTFSGVESNLDTLASGFADIMNDIQCGTPAGQTGTRAMCLDANKQLTISGATNFLFVNGDSAVTSATGITAANIKVNSALIGDTNLIAASRLSQAEIDKGQAIYGKETGNTTNMSLVISSRSKTYAETGNTTVEKFMANFVGDIGSKVEHINDNADTQATVLDSVKTKLNSQMGVNLDEELTDLMKYQQAYQAASRVFNVCNELLDGLMHLGE